MPKLAQQFFGSSRLICQLLALGPFDFPAYATVMETAINRVQLGPEINLVKSKLVADGELSCGAGYNLSRYRSELDVFPALRTASMKKRLQNNIKLRTINQRLTMIGERNRNQPPARQPTLNPAEYDSVRQIRSF